MRHRVAAFLVLLIVALPASAGFEYVFEGYVTEDDTLFFPPGTPITGRLFWSPENAVLQTTNIYSNTYSNVYSYEYNIGGVSFTSLPDPLTLVLTTHTPGVLVYDLGLTDVTPFGVVDEISFWPLFPFTSLDMDFSGVWGTNGVLILPVPGLHIESWWGVVTMTKVPEPGTLILFASFAALVALVRRRRPILRQ